MSGLWAAGSVWAAWLVDAVLGEPPVWAHPVVWLGRVIRPLTRLRKRPAHVEQWLGFVYTASLTLGAALLALLVERLCAQYGPVRWALHVFLLKGCFAWRGLLSAGGVVQRALAADDLTAARDALSALCSRSAESLSGSEVAGAAIESTTENTSDSVVAPLFYYVCFGLPGLVFYRAANTMDAMVGYHGRYEYLGKAAARLDDLLNLLPARLTAALLWLSGLLLRLDARAGLRVCLRDARRTESPNAGFPMAMAAGLLGVRLDKREAYTLGAELSPPDAAQLSRALRLVAFTGVAAVALAAPGAWLGEGALWVLR